jgi:hypothetical protein
MNAASARVQRLCATLALLLAPLTALVAQQPEGSPPATGAAGPAQAPPAAAGDAPATSPASAVPTTPRTAEELLASTLPADIATASYYELVAWCLQLRLDDTGSRPDLQARLAAHFGVTLPTPSAPSVGKTVSITSARESAYRTDAASGEKYLELRGDVDLVVTDAAGGSRQEITAAAITFNQTRRTVSAVGAVTYTLTSGGQTDTFTGQSLAFDLDSSEAVFYDGATTRTVSRSGKQVPYTFRGSTITRLTNDTVIMQDGSITTSSGLDDPLLQLHAGTAWLLAPGEWAAGNALLMVGRVPVLWLPGFFWPGEEFVFNPNVGYEARRGSFLQTTTYLLGRKKSTDAPFSFLQLSSAGAGGYDLVPDGLFLRKVPGSSPAAATTDTLKLLLDLYSRLGIFAGVTGDFSSVGTFRAAVGFTQSVFPDPLASGSSTPFLPVAVPGYELGQTVPNTSTLLGMPVPFRYGIDGTVKAAGDLYSVNGSFQYYADPAFTSDFYSRSEAGILANLASSGSGSAPAAAGSTTVAPQANLSWDASGRLDFSRLLKSSVVQTLSFPTIGLHMGWQSHSPSSSTLTYVQQYDPGSSFYFPTSLTAPNITFSLAGELLRLPGASAPASTPAPTPSVTAPVSATQSTPDSSADPGKGVRFTFPPPPAAAPAEEVARVPLRAPTHLPDDQAATASGASTLSVTYQFQPRATLDHTFDSADWTTPQAVDFGIKYRTLETGGTTAVTGAASLWDRTLDLSLAVAADALWRGRFDPSAAEAGSADWQTLVLRDLQQDRLNLRTNLLASVRPLQAIPSLASSTLQYRLGVKVYQLAWDPVSGTVSPLFVTPALAWDTTTIAEHSLAASLAYTQSWTSDSLALTAQLPPLTPVVGATSSLSVGPVKARVQAGFSDPATGLVWQPLVAGVGADFGSGFTAGEEIQYDIGGGTLQRSTSTVGWGPFSGSFVALWMLPVDGLGSPVPGGVLGLYPSSVKFGYESVSNPQWYWLDRVKADLNLKTHWSLNLQKYTDNLFDFTFGLTFNVYKALDLTMSSYSTNSRTYRYIPGWAEAVGEVWVNPFADLLDSFNFFNLAARQRSAFKIRTLSISAAQHFPDWDLSVTYLGAPQLRTDPTDGRQKYMWTPSFAVQVQWNAVPEVKSTVKDDHNGVTLR